MDKISLAIWTPRYVSTFHHSEQRMVHFLTIYDVFVVSKMETLIAGIAQSRDSSRYSIFHPNFAFKI